ncbi:ATP-grasp domain-containing protein [Cecembia lonarensis]|uniref:Carbamoyl phosphate synthase-like protein n=1 Tax=Cecembia lonarensis (strain CCUG 58316 / KCTC 22772 / LW9) TaxID=1225176 RepID=K1KWV3_CECL9|nr:ATP-grasp domain-containing protein [Cecembia lonarensis]EKB48620.1 carbamoyl phosphate synthase-like protein [Cecembia lonarensis LW9]
MNILFTSVGRRDYILDYFKSLKGKNIKVYAVNSVANTTAMWKADKSFISPEIRSNEYIPFLLDISKREKIDLIISLFDLDTLFISFYKEKFEELGVKVLVSDLGIIENCLDKLKMSSWLNAHGFKTPKTFEDLSGAKKSLEINDVSFPLILKPQWGQGSLSTEIVSDQIELESAYTFLNSKVRKTSIAHVEKLNYKNKILIQEFIEGEEYGIDCINNLSGENQAVVIKKKIAMRAGETDGALTVYDDQIESTISNLGNKLKHISILDVDAINNESGVYIIDMNPRFGGGYPFSHLAGVDLPRAIVDWVATGFADKSLFSYQEGVLGLKGIAMVSKSEIINEA